MGPGTLGPSITMSNAFPHENGGCPAHMRKLNRIFAMTYVLVCLVIFAGSSTLHAQAKFENHGQGSQLNVTSFPTGAHVSVDGVDTRQRTPAHLGLRPGKHQVRVFVPESGWNADNRTLNVTPGNNDVDVTLLPTVAVGPAGPAGPQGLAGLP